MSRKTIQYQICGLDYIYLRVPVAKTKDGEEYIDLPMDTIDKTIAKHLIENKIPIRGAEVIFLRKSLGMSLNDWAKKFGMSAAGVLKWEKSKDNRLSRVNEAAVRALCAELLKVNLKGTWSELVADSFTPKKLSLKIDDAA